MKFTELSEYLHRLRQQDTGRSVGYRMTAMEIWQYALACPLNRVQSIRVRETELPSPFDGFFARFAKKDNSGDLVEVFVDSELDKHWKEFVVAKELMHCWSPKSTYVPSSGGARSLVEAFSGKSNKYTASVAADSGAVVAACEVILPHYVVRKDLEKGWDFLEVANQHDLHPDVAHMICNIELMPHRINGCL